MVVNNSESMPDMFSIYYELICFFVMYLLGLLIGDQLFLGLIKLLIS